MRPPYTGGTWHDTSPAAEARYFELLAERSPVERLAIALRLSTMVRTLAEAAIRADAPALADRAVRNRLADRLYGPEVAEKVFPVEDVVAVLRISASQIDDSYLDSWAPRLDLTALLSRARVAAGRA